MDEIISESRSSKSVWTVAVIAIVLFVVVSVLAGSFTTAEITSVATN